MARLDEPTPPGVCGYAFVSSDRTWQRCTSYPGHSDAHNVDESVEPAGSPALDGADIAYVGSHTTETGRHAAKDNTRRVQARRVSS